MKMNVRFGVVVFLLLSGIVAAPSFAALGLQGVFSDQGIDQVALEVNNAVEKILASAEDDASAQSQIAQILNEAVATGNEQIVRYTIVAVLRAGGIDNLELCKAGINSSTAPEKYRGLTASTIAVSESVIRAEARKKKGKGDDQGGGKDGDQGGGKDDGQGGGKGDEQGGGKDQGGGFEDLFDADINDGDVPGTPV